MQIHGRYSLLKKQQRLYFRKFIDRDLQFFWKRFHKDSKEEKLKLLQDFSKIKYNYSPQIGHQRKEFNNNLRMKKLLYSSCYVCGNKPTIAHHIIQIQNGGLNIKKNITRICKDCHEKIHDWVK